MYYCAIDPGANAAIAVITGPTTVLTVDCRKNLKDAFDLLLSLKDHAHILGVEKVHAIWGASAKTTFSFGSNCGFWYGVLAYIGLTYVDIEIPKWQAATTNKLLKPITKGLSVTQRRKINTAHKANLKMESFRAATVAFPSSRFPSHDVADAVNMARYLRMIHENQKVKTVV